MHFNDPGELTRFLDDSAAVLEVLRLLTPVFHDEQALAAVGHTPEEQEQLALPKGWSYQVERYVENQHGTFAVLLITAPTVLMGVLLRTYVGQQRAQHQGPISRRQWSLAIPVAVTPSMAAAPAAATDAHVG